VFFALGFTPLLPHLSALSGARFSDSSLKFLLFTHFSVRFLYHKSISFSASCQALIMKFKKPSIS